MADLSDNTNWFEVDASNNKAPPNGWPEGMMPSGVNDAARANMGALKRWWDRSNPVQTITPAGGIWVFNTTNPLYPIAYVDGETYTFKAGVASAAGDQFQVNVLPAKPIWRRISSGTGWAPIAAQDIQPSCAPHLIYNATLNGGAGAFVLLDPYVPAQGDGAGGISMPGNLVVGGTGSFTGGVTAPSFFSTGPTSSFTFQARDNGTQNWLWYATGNAARLNMGGVDKALIDTSGNMTLGGSLTAGTNLRATSFYLYLAGGSGAVNGSGGPFVYADNGTMAFHLGAANANWLFQDAGGTNVCTINSVGAISCTSETINGPVSATGRITSSAGGTAVYAPNGDINTGGSIISAGSTFNGSSSIWLTGSHIRSQANIYADGAMFAPAFNVISDATVKEGIADSAIGLDAVCRLAPKTYRRIATPDREELGLVAQDVLAVLPQAVVTVERDEPHLAINYTQIATALIGAVKELTARLATLEAKCSTLT